jgi:hypothetical protein
MTNENAPGECIHRGIFLCISRYFMSINFFIWDSVPDLKVQK